MAQRFYQKASVQVAIVTTIGLIIVTLITIFHQRSELRLDNKNLQTKLSDSEKVLIDVKAERDKYQTQLAPFLAIAERSFPGESTNKRLELLLTKLDKAINDVQSAARKVSPKRTLGAKLEQTLIANLKSSHPINVKITGVMGDTESLVLANQIKEVFNRAGWGVKAVDQKAFINPIRGLVLVFGKAPPPALKQALTPLLKNFSPRRAMLNEQLGEKNMEIIVGSK